MKREEVTLAAEDLLRSINKLKKSNEIQREEKNDIKIEENNDKIGQEKIIKKEEIINIEGKKIDGKTGNNIELIKKEGIISKIKEKSDKNEEKVNLQKKEKNKLIKNEILDFEKI